MTYPPLEGFRAIRTTHGFGEPMTVLRDDRDLTLRFTEDGMRRLEQDPPFADFVQSMGEFIIRHDGYQPVELAREHAGGYKTVRKVACVNRSYDKNDKASVYAPEAIPDTIIKAFDLDPHIGNLQFKTMNWLQAAIRRHKDAGLVSPRQYVHFTAPKSGHQTTLQERIPGKPLCNVLAPCDTKLSFVKYFELTTLAMRMVEARLTSVAGPIWPALLDDVTQRGVKNIFLDAKEINDAATLSEQTFGIIDQPASRYIGRLIHHMIGDKPGR